MTPEIQDSAVPKTEIAQGRLVGCLDRGVPCFRGIPYASSTAGSGRFRAPGPAPVWTGVRDASQPGHSAPQLARRIQVLPTGAQQPLDEDCLNLNVWTPAVDGARRPVFVYVHGGAFRRGEGSSPLYAGDRLAARGDAVVVTLNYRLGALGFLNLATLGGSERGCSANLALLDQIAALEWVRDNVEHFGGDPANVTLCGESAGGMCVTSLMAMPRARGLFRRAIAQSGAGHNFLTPEQGDAVARAFLGGLGASGAGDLDRVFAASWQQLLEAQAKVDAALADPLDTLWFQPVLDPETLPLPPIEALAKGSAAGVELLLGTNLEEWNFFSFLDPRVQQLTQEGLLDRIAVRVAASEASAQSPAGQRARAAELIETYAKERPEATPGQIFCAIETDRVFRMPAIRLAEVQQPHAPAIYKYLFTYASPALEGRLGACHALDLPFVFGHTGEEILRGLVGEGPQVDALSARMMEAWLGFARSGDPIDWPPYELERRATLRLGPDSDLMFDPYCRERQAWEDLI